MNVQDWGGNWHHPAWEWGTVAWWFSHGFHIEEKSKDQGSMIALLGDAILIWASSPPTSFCYESGRMRKTVKAVMTKKADRVWGGRNTPVLNIVILDATVPACGRCPAAACIMKRGKSSNVLHVVFHRYEKSSIKSCCRTTHQWGFSRVYKPEEE